MTDASYMMRGEVERMFEGSGPGWRAQMERMKYDEPQLIAGQLERLLQGGVLEAPLLDLGCGTGLNGTAVRRFCRRLEGVDLSPSMLAVAAETSLYDELHQGEAVSFLHGRTGYGAITAAGLCCFLSDLHPLFEAVARALQADGLFVFTNDALAGPGPVATSPRHPAMTLHSIEHIVDAARRARLQVESYQRSVVRLDFYQLRPIEGAVTVLRKT